MLDHDTDAIIRTHARDRKVTAWLQDTAEAFEEIGEVDFAIDWAKQATDFDRGHDSNDVWERLTKDYEKHDPLAVVPILTKLVEDELTEAGAQHYRNAARRLKKMRKLAAGSDKATEVDHLLAELRETHRRRPRLQQEFNRAGLPFPVAMVRRKVLSTALPSPARGDRPIRRRSVYRPTQSLDLRPSARGPSHDAESHPGPTRASTFATHRLVGPVSVTDLVTGGKCKVSLLRQKGHLTCGYVVAMHFLTGQDLSLRPLGYEHPNRPSNLSPSLLRPWLSAATCLSVTHSSPRVPKRLAPSWSPVWSRV
ncbi:MAG: hypothetical protein ACRDPJ_19015, partial [Nocardioidaceae bacterium]